MNRKKGILAAATFTGLILITVLALGFGRLQASSADNGTASQGTALITAPAGENVSSDQALQEWQAYSKELEQTVRTLQQRETVYQQQLDEANQTITALQDQINSANSGPSFFFGEPESHERGEHEGSVQIFGGIDD